MQVMSQPPIDDAAVAAADKEMEERANRAKELLSKRYTGLKVQQVRRFCCALFLPGRSLTAHPLTLLSLSVCACVYSSCFSTLYRNKSSIAKWYWNARWLA